MALTIAGSSLVHGGSVHGDDLSFQTETEASFWDVTGTDDYFRGEVYATDGGRACEEGRTVKLYRVQRGRDKLIAQTTSGYIDFNGGVGFGTWRVDREDPRDGKYYSKVTAKDVDPSREHAHVCQAARSGLVVVTDDPNA